MRLSSPEPCESEQYLYIFFAGQLKLCAHACLLINHDEPLSHHMFTVPLCTLDWAPASNSRGNWAPSPWCSWAAPGSRQASGSCGLPAGRAAGRTSGRPTWPSPGRPSRRSGAAARPHTLLKSRQENQTFLYIVILFLVCFIQWVCLCLGWNE